MTRPVPPLRILVVEDEALLAMDLILMIEDAGHTIVGEAACLTSFEALDDDIDPDIAFVDVQLAHGSNGLDVCARIRTRWASTVIVFVTANPKKLPQDFAGAHGVIPKPFSRNGMMSAIRYIEEGVCAPPPRSPPPTSFQPSTAFEASWST